MRIKELLAKKVCTKCGVKKEKITINFAACPQSRDGLQSWCRECWRKWHKGYEHERRHNPETRPLVLAKDKKGNRKRTQLDHRRNNLKKHHGLSLEEWERIFELQSRGCAACESKVPRSKKGWATDHDHRTGQVRGILCQPCNMALGLVKESIDILRGLIAYLNKVAECR